MYCSQLATDLAIATRLLQWQGILDYSGHIGVRIQGEPRILIQPRDLSRSKVTPSDILAVSIDDESFTGDRRPPSELAIHIEILKARPEIQCVLHCHMEEAIVFTLMDEPLVPMRSHAARWGATIPIHPVASHVTTSEQGRSLVASLGAADAVLLRAHGIVLASTSLQALLADAVHFRENARALLTVLQSGSRPKPLGASEIEDIRQTLEQGHHSQKVWSHYVEKGIEAGILPSAWFSNP